jgi:hypothetical protein
MLQTIHHIITISRPEDLASPIRAFKYAVIGKLQIAGGPGCCVCAHSAILPFDRTLFLFLL